MGGYKPLKNKKKGFTLIELLAVIVILAIIAVITTPMVLNIVSDTRKSSVTRSAEGILKSAKNYYMQNELKGNLVNEEIDLTSDILEYDGEKPEKGIITFDEKGNVSLSIYLRGYCITKAYDGTIITEKKEKEDCKILVKYKDVVLNGADPELDNGMIPVIIEADGTVKKADIYEEWYNYTNNKWANAVLVNKDKNEIEGSKSRAEYKVSETDTTILESDILAYFVWIPRYKYTMPEENQKPINIVFENKKTTKSIGTATGTDYCTHPAFTFGDTQIDGVELNGLWVGKFETSTNDSTCNEEQSETACKNVSPLIKPNVSSLKNQNVSTQFKILLKLGNRTLNDDGTIINNEDKTTYGLQSESRMIKNTEWGSVAYLTQSKYGKCEGEICTEVRNSNYFKDEKTLTGCGTTSPNGGITTSCQIEYGKVVNGVYPQSTTGNINGIFDMSGGAWEYVMGVMEDSLGSGKPASGNNSTSNSGINGKYAHEMYGSKSDGVNFPNRKYYDLYTYGTSSSDYTRAILGDGTKETKEWYNDSAYFVYQGIGGSFFRRGGYYSDLGGAGIFNFYYYNGAATSKGSCRAVITITS